MKKGYLSQHFESVAAKRISAVEADPGKSHQHEFNGTKELQRVLGPCGEKKQFPAIFLWFGNENEGISNEGSVTWYDARLNHPTRSECRLYFPTTDVAQLARENDVLFIAKRTDGTVMIIITASGSTVEYQLFWLFGLDTPSGTLFEYSEIEKTDVEVDFAVRFILDELGIEVEEPEVEKLDAMLAPFNGVLPGHFEFSQFVRSSLKNMSVMDDPDAALLAWMDQEEKLFRRIERHNVERRIKEGFVSDDGTDINGFLNYSFQVQDRRKARVNFSLENHLEAIFKGYNLKFVRGAVTENNSKPSFLFPGIAEYNNPNFLSSGLRMLAARSNCKEKWRQVTNEASRIERKHLLTLEPSISLVQTLEMESAKIALVIPKSIQDSYLPRQRESLLTLRQFISQVGQGDVV